VKACDKYSLMQRLAGALLYTVLPHCSYILQVSVCGLWFGNFIVMFCGLFGKEEEMGETVACMEEKKN